MWQVLCRSAKSNVAPQRVAWHRITLGRIAMQWIRTRCIRLHGVLSHIASCHVIACYVALPRIKRTHVFNRKVGRRVTLSVVSHAEHGNRIGTISFVKMFTCRNMYVMILVMIPGYMSCVYRITCHITLRHIVFISFRPECIALQQIRLWPRPLYR